MYVYELVLNSNPTILQHPLDPPRQRQHQVLQVLAVALLQGGGVNSTERLIPPY